MTNKNLLTIIKNSPSIEILRSKNRELIFDFFLTVFNNDNKRNISSEDIILSLTDFLNHHNIHLEETESNTIDTLEIKAKNAIKNWTNKGFLTNYKNENGDVFYELSTHTNKTINWIYSLEKKEFVGAESKFKDIFNKLKELVEFTNEDVDKRIEILEDKKLKIEQEIQQLKIDEDVKIFETHEIIPRFQELTYSAKELLSDFKEVEDNFKNITKDIYKKQTNQNFTKKDILTFTFDALDDLKESHQGKNFYAFWKFLIDTNFQEEWNVLTDELYQTLTDKNIPINDAFLKNMKSYLHASGNKVYQANDKMADKLSRIIRENDNSDKKNSKKVILQIKNYLTQISETKKTPDLSIAIELNNNIHIPFDKHLTLQQKKEITYNKKPKIAENDISKSVQLNKIFKENAIDKNLLRKRIKEMLRLKSQITLHEIIENYGGIKKGLPEIFGYLGIIKDFTHSFNSEKQQEIIFDKINNKAIKIPEIILIK
ncbi:DUF3375 domain-containing protein [Tenacibaculum finnmarkense genomovar ulcerans]|uniref:DUF3375 family protein n=1 Tax=Tenacibaculum finnmarkense TaxID=2781243 RepID=UPI001E614B9F|nr:DUF3375 family protein [Tenacibaculum finnmarkense]MCD8454227.1 DUF3375 domain-containing protein [Tenacibaculum finnmarkense genomovar ulcerans]